MFNRNIYCLFFILTCLTVGCKEFIEPSLDHLEMKLLAPSDQLESTIYQQTFWWEKQDDAIAYRLQIVSPNFQNAAQLVLDTLVKNDKFIFTLEPGQYQWRVRAENGSTSTKYAERSLIIYPSGLTAQKVQLISPANTFITSNSSVKYEWLKLFGATQYRLQVDDHDFADSNAVVLNTTISQTVFNQSLTKEGKYAFRVRAENVSQNSKWSEIRYFTFDNTPPEQVVLTAPADKQMVSKPVKLSWDAVNDANQYELVLYKADSTTLLSADFPILLNKNEYALNAGEVNDKVFWKVRAIDKAGNKGIFSKLFSFTIQ